jgi:DNA invertase Pin-like site-specific DNA recombinase
MDTKKPRAVMYLRARHLGPDGTDRAIEEAQIEAQRRACTAVADQLGVALVREYAEHGGTGPIEDRPELRLMLDELTALHDVRYVIATSVDRLARRTSDLRDIRLSVEAAGAEIVTPSQAAYYRSSGLAELFERMGGAA